MSEWHNIVHTGRDLPPQLANHALVQIGVTEYHTRKKMVLQHEQAEGIIIRVKVEEKECKLRSEKSTRHVSESSSHSRRNDTLTAEVKSPSKPKPARRSNFSEQMRANKQYSFKDEHVVSLFKLLYKSNKLKLQEARRPE